MVRHDLFHDCLLFYSVESKRKQSKTEIENQLFQALPCLYNFKFQQI